MLKAILAAIFVGDEQWAWHRRIAVTSAGVMLMGFIHSTFWDPDLAHATMVMNNSITGLSLVFTIYVSGAVVDDQNKRKAGISAEDIK